MFKTILLITLVLISDNSYAKLKQYYCANFEDQKTCSNSCAKKERSTSWEFLTNPNKNVVLKNFYINDVLEKSEPLENCSVVDSKNWVCNVMGSSIKGVNDLKLGTEIMTNGVYFYMPYRHSLSADNIWCMK